MEFRLNGNAIEYCIVDDEDFEKIKQHKWYLTVGLSNIKYVKTHIYKNGKKTTISLHRFIINAQQGEIVDHIDGNGLNNSKQNLRICSHGFNLLYRHKKYINKTSQYIGVSWNQKDKRWISQLVINGKHYYIGSFKSETIAYQKYLEYKQNKVFGSL